jgi:CubicO group peptidase (beta-lactamase class C family)
MFGHDGKTTWYHNESISPEPQIIPAEQALILTRYEDFGALFLDYKNKNQKFQYAGTEDIDGKKAHKLKTTFKTGISRFVFLDDASLLNIKESFIPDKQKELKVDVSYRDFRKVAGILLPYVHELSPEEQFQIDRIETNIDIDDSIFKVPQKLNARKKLRVPEFIKSLEAHITSITERDGFSGVVLVARNREPIFTKAYGEADIEQNIPNRIDTKFNLGSIQKTFTAVAIAQLVEKGKLSYDDFAGKYLGPDWILPEVGKVVTISHLLSHTSGITEYLSDEEWLATAHIRRTLEDHKALIRDKALIFEPGSRWSYCNAGFILLGAIIENVSGEKYEDYMKKHIYEPLGMYNTVLDDPDKTTTNMAMGYAKIDKNGKSEWQKTSFAGIINASPAGGAYSTAADLLKFAAALHSDKLLERKSSKFLMTLLPGFEDNLCGHGFFVNDHLRLGLIAGHGGGAPGVSTNFRLLLDMGYTVIILSNYSEASIGLWEKIKAMLPLQ